MTSELRELVQSLVTGLWDSGPHHQLPELCQQLGIPEPPTTEISADGETVSLSKRERMQKCFELTDPAQDIVVLEAFLEHGQLLPQRRNEVQDAIWTRERWPEITLRTRREIAEALKEFEPSQLNPRGFWRLLDELWVLETDIDLWTGTTLRASIEQHVLRNPGDWTVLELFEQLGALSASDRRFALFLEGLLSPEVTPDESHQRTTVSVLSAVLERANLKVVEVGSRDGYPVFRIVSTGAHVRPPQLILFASLGSKPDVRVREVLDAELEVVRDPGDVLRYDRPISDAGLTWDDLQAWWADREGVGLEEAKVSLWQRLVAALPDSPPQEAFFRSYYKILKNEPRIPALLPEVWLHWDPRTRSQRGEHAFLSQRMDFLLLLEQHRRVVLEVDGAQHYSTEGSPSPVRYAETMKADRDLRLSGYEVYRFGGAELSKQSADQTVVEFLERLLVRTLTQMPPEVCCTEKLSASTRPS